MQKEEKNVDLRLWLKIGAAALVLIAIGMIVAVFANEGGVAAVFKDFLELETINIVLLIVAIVALVAGIFGLVVMLRKAPAAAVPTQRGWTTKQLVVGALCVGLAFVLSYIRLWKMPMGGSITPASMLPIMLFAYIYGTPKGLVVGVVYGLLQMIQDPWIVHWAQALLDYIFAFACLSLAGLFQKKLIAGEVIAVLGRFFCAFLSGMIFFGEYGLEYGMSPVVYSLVYQATYLVPEIVICLAVSLIPPIRKNIELLKRQALSSAAHSAPQA